MDPVERAIVRARRLRQRGELRRAVVALREATAVDEWSPRSWALLGALLRQTGRSVEAAAAFRHARWLRLRAGDPARAQVLERLLAEM